MFSYANLHAGGEGDWCRDLLYPRDAIHAATALLRNAEDFYSEDADFDSVDGLHRRWMR